MSSVLVNDENQAVCLVQKHIPPEAPGDFFTLDQPTGRPSILRQSQAENVVKNVPKGVKVCFQTPRRDPVTKKIMSPSRVGRICSVNDCAKALESLTLSTSTAEMASSETESTILVDVPSKNDVPYPDDDMPIQSKGGYTIDFDNLDSLNPFQSSNRMVLSPPKSAVLVNTNAPPEVDQPDTIVSTIEAVETVPEKPEQADMALDETLPLTQSVENSLTDLSTNPSADSTVIIVPKTSGTPILDQSSNESESVELPEPALTTECHSVTDDAPEAVDSPLPPKGSYNIDFDHLDAVNPFQNGGSKIQNSPPLSRKASVSNSPSPKTENKLSEAKTENVEVVGETKLSVTTMPGQTEMKSAHTEIPSDSTESSAPPASPPKGAQMLVEFVSVTNMPGQTEMKSTDSEIPSDLTESSAPPASPPKGAQMLLEFNFDDGANVKRKPPPKRLGRNRPDAKKPASVPAVKKAPEPEPKPKSPNVMDDSAPIDIPVRGAYNFDFDKFDDPNFNPFGTKAKMGSSPTHGDRSSPVLGEAAQPAAPEQSSNDNQLVRDGTVENDTHSSLPSDADEMIAEAKPALTKLEEEVKPSLVTQDTMEREMSPEPLLQRMRVQLDMAGADEEFVPGSMFMPSDFDGQIDYLEQFGSSTFKESALRKQSLYLKFDPLLKESPKKAAPDCSSSGFSLPRPSLAIRMMEAARSEVRHKAQHENTKKESTKVLQETKLLEDFPPPVEIPAVRDPTVLDLLVPTFKQPQKCEDVIVEMLKYSQRDMDSALEKAHKQAEEKEEALKAQIEKLLLDNQHMRLVVSDFEAFIAQLTADHKQKEDLAQGELSKALQEKQQLAKDLSDMERSFSDVVKRLDRRKEVIDGFKKNEETLKQCAQSYLAKLQKEEQRYQMLKTHAEEKIDQANKEIAEVRSKLGAEVSALQVQLRREQLKVQSLEKNLEQKVKEVEDVTKLCDELIMKVQKH